MRQNCALLLLLAGLLLNFSSCKKEDEPAPVENEIKGAVGNPRFNLQFTNSQNADLDLHVLTPNGSEIYYANDSGQGGTLDIDCLCYSCPSGPNENIYWPDNGSAPQGTYKVWVEYYGDCGGTSASSEFTLRIMKNQTILHTYKGTLTATNDKSAEYTFNF